LSGPAILQISSYWSEGDVIRLDLAPDRDVTAAIRDAKVRNYRRGAFRISGDPAETVGHALARFARAKRRVRALLGARQNMDQPSIGPTGAPGA